MATTVAFALNTGSTIAGTIQIGDIAVGAAGTYDYSTNPGGVKWWMGPDEDLGYLIIAPDTGFTHQSPTGTNAGVKFKRSTELTESSFLELTNHFASSEYGETPFTGNTEAKNWLNALGFPSSFNSNEPEITTYISGLTTPLCAYQVGVLNKFVLDIKSGYNINAFTDVFDVMLILSNETPESSLRNLVKRQHDGIAVNSPTFTPYLGFKTSGTNYINTKYSIGDNVRFRQGTAYDSMVGVYTHDSTVINYIEGVRGTGYYWVNNISSTGGIVRVDDVDATVTSTSFVAPQLFCYGRNSATTIRVIRFDESHSEMSGFTNNYTNPSYGERYLLCTNLLGTPFWSTPRPTASLYLLSRMLTYDEANIIWTAFRNYLISHGTD